MANPDVLVLFRLITAHLLADFLLQPKRWIVSKRTRNVRAPELYYHVGVVGLLTYLMLWDWLHVLLPLFIMGTHFAIDWWKSTRRESAGNFVIDQAGHLVMILAGWIFYTGLADEANAFLLSLLYSPALWIVLTGYITVLWPFGYLVALLTKRWQEELENGSTDSLTGLKNAGMWIGYTERFIILTFILLNQYSAIGFLIAAKSVFRFSGKLESDRDRKEAEYILIGTLLSFALSIALGIGAVYLLELLPAEG
ncbi:MAG: DUF3307 domain-containing protein [Balneolaceae bacterium]|nr:DUF3307 domain-containing protein [Balneolaceae bacterium]